MAHHDLVTGAIVLDDDRVTDGDVRGLLLEVGHGIAAIDHGAANEPIRRAHGCGRIVDEAALHGGPLHRIRFAIDRREGAEGKFLHAFFAFRQGCFGNASVAVLLKDGAVVLRPKAPLELFGPATADNESHRDDDENDNSYSDRYQYSGVHFPVLFAMRCGDVRRMMSDEGE